jgi:hypothetical protein
MRCNFDLLGAPRHRNARQTPAAITAAGVSIAWFDNTVIQTGGGYCRRDRRQ